MITEQEESNQAQTLNGFIDHVAYENSLQACDQIFQYTFNASKDEPYTLKTESLLLDFQNAFTESVQNSTKLPKALSAKIIDFISFGIAKQKLLSRFENLTHERLSYSLFKDEIKERLTRKY